MTQRMTYRGSGIDYDSMDPFKRVAQLTAKQTAGNIRRLGLEELEMSRGESVYLVERLREYLAHVEEGLGSKCLVADAMYKLTGKSYYDQIAQDTVAMIVNDMITLGALPISVAMHLAVGNSDWFNDEKRYRDLINGWKTACDMALCTWGGGETPTLKDIVIPGTTVISGSAIGIIKPKKRLIDPKRIRAGDAIMFFASSGIHANGLTLARGIADKLPEGYLTKLKDGRTYGETLLDPTYIYTSLIEYLLVANTKIHYAVNITGHGWRKLMRANQSLAYTIDVLPEPMPIFDFIQENGPVDTKEMYGNLNMGAGFAIFVPESEIEYIGMIAHTVGLKSWYAGHIERSEGKKVVIRPLGLEYIGSTLQIR